MDRHRLGGAFQAHAWGGVNPGRHGADEDAAGVATFFLEPHVSAGVATCRWFGVEFQLSVPVFLLAEDLSLTVADRTHVVTGGDLTGVDFRLKLTTGKIAELL